MRFGAKHPICNSVVRMHALLLEFVIGFVFRSRLSCFVFLATLLTLSPSAFASSKVTYHGRIMKPDGTPLGH